jgi:hypothetical protein
MCSHVLHSHVNSPVSLLTYTWNWCCPQTIFSDLFVCCTSQQFSPFSISLVTLYALILTNVSSHLAYTFFVYRWDKPTANSQFVILSTIACWNNISTLLRIIQYRLYENTTRCMTVVYEIISRLDSSIKCNPKTSIHSRQIMQTYQGTFNYLMECRIGSFES